MKIDQSKNKQKTKKNLFLVVLLDGKASEIFKIGAVLASMGFAQSAESGHF